MGIDFGSKRVGVALSHDEGKIGMPYSVITNDRDLLSNILKIIKEEDVNKVVVGESKDFKGEPNKIMQKAEVFIDELIKAGVEVVLEPEFLSTFQAERWQGKNENIDASAAAIILQSYLDRETR